MQSGMWSFILSKPLVFNVYNALMPEKRGALEKAKGARIKNFAFNYRQSDWPISDLRDRLWRLHFQKYQAKRC
jgi:hypothetical protein